MITSSLNFAYLWRTKRLMPLLAVICCCAIPAYSQNRCKLKPADSPELRGFKLGMTTAQAKALTEWEIKGQKNERDVLKATVTPLQLKSREDAKGIKQIELSFFDDRLITIGVIYDDSVKWDNVDAFAAKVSESFNLPNTWIAPTDEKIAAYGRMLDCDGFRIAVAVAKEALFGVLEQNVIALFFSDQTANPIIDRRYEEKEKRKRQTFKP